MFKKTITFLMDTAPQTPPLYLAPQRAAVHNSQAH